MCFLSLILTQLLRFSSSFLGPEVEWTAVSRTATLGDFRQLKATLKIPRVGPGFSICHALIASHEVQELFLIAVQVYSQLVLSKIAMLLVVWSLCRPLNLFLPLSASLKGAPRHL